MAPKASKPVDAASSPVGGGLNQVLARGKLLARIRKEKSEAEKSGEVYDYPPETPLLEDGSSDMTLGDLMAAEQLSKKKAVKVMMKFRAEAEATAKAEAASNPKALACLPEDAAPASSSSKPAPKPKPLKIADGTKTSSKKSEERDEQGVVASKKHVPNKEKEEQPSTGKKAMTKAARQDDAEATACEKNVGDNPGTSKGRKRNHEPANNEQAAAAATEAADHTQKKKKTKEASAPIEVPDTQIDAAVNEQEGTDEAAQAKKNKKRERDGNDARMEKSKEKKEKKDKRKHAREVQEMIDEIDAQMSAPEAEPTLEAMASVAGLPRAPPSTRVTSKRAPPPPCPPATNEAPMTEQPRNSAAQEAASSTAEDHHAFSGLSRASSEDRQPDPTESELDTQHGTWSFGVHGGFRFLDLQHPATVSTIAYDVCYASACAMF